MAGVDGGGDAPAVREPELTPMERVEQDICEPVTACCHESPPLAPLLDLAAFLLIFPEFILLPFLLVDMTKVRIVVIKVVLYERVGFLGCGCMSME